MAPGSEDPFSQNGVLRLSLASILSRQDKAVCALPHLMFGLFWSLCDSRRV